jgi:uncharacterized protein (DUF305 family)
VIEEAALREAILEEPAAATPRSTPGAWMAIVLALLAVLAALMVVWFQAIRPPGDDSLEAGFARDMIVHHDQAVAMALLIRDRTADPAVKTLATDILLTQQNQIGQMLGWLNVWGLSATGEDLPMAWMGHPTSRRMPGMASQEELDILARLSGEAADAEFLRLMIRHHQGGIPMAEAAWQQSGNQPVRDLAHSIVTAQEIEIATMEDLLRQKEGSAERS